MAYSFSGLRGSLGSTNEQLIVIDILYAWRLMHAEAYSDNSIAEVLKSEMAKDSNIFSSNNLTHMRMTKL